MKKITTLILSLLIAAAAPAQGIYNNGARIVCQTGSYWVVDNGAFTLTSASTANPTTFANLSISNDASLTIPSLNYLTVTGMLTNSSGNDGLVVNSGGSLIENTTGVSGTVSRNIPAGEWHLISAPISDAVSGMFTDYYLQKFTESANDFSDITSTTQALTPAMGFALFGDAKYPSAVFAGPLNAGTKSYTVTKSGSPGEGWNLIGNPYPSTIDWDASAGWTKTNVNAATYVHINPATWASYVGTTETNGGSRYIAPAQGFFVKASAVGSLVMTDAVRVHSGTSFFKSAQVVSNLIRLQVSGNGYKDEAVLRFLSESSAEFDGDYDAHKFFGDVPEAAQIYTIGITELAINSMPVANTVPLGVRAASGSYTISATQINDLPYAILEDTKTGVFTDLSAKPYTFTFTAGENEQRFILHFTEMLSIDKGQKAMATIYSYHKTAYIKMNDTMKGDIFIYNITGQLVASRLSASGMNEIILPNTGAYIVKVISAKNAVVKKVIIN